MTQPISQTAPPAPRRFSGRESAARGWLTFFFFSLMASPFIYWLYARVGLGECLLGLGVFAVLCQGTRWRVTIGAEGVELREWIGWVWPYKTQRFLLDARIQIYQTLESDYEEGIEIADYNYWDESSDCFGPDGRSAEYEPLLAAMQAALKEARAYVERVESHAAPRLRHRLLSGSPAFDARSASWHRVMSGRGLFENRVHEIQSLQDVSVAGMTIPAGSLFTFNSRLTSDPDAWMDPRRSDVLTQIQCSAPTRVPNFGEVSAGSTLNFAGSDRLSSVYEAGGRQFSFRGFVIDGNQVVGFRDGHPSEFYLAQARTLGGYPLAAETYVEQTFGFANWQCTLVEPLALPEVTLLPGDRLVVHASMKYPVYAVHKHEISLGKKHIQGGALIFLKRNGRINTRKH